VGSKILSDKQTEVTNIPKERLFENAHVVVSNASYTCKIEVYSGRSEDDPRTRAVSSLYII
jgi:hypothetical protein